MTELASSDLRVPYHSARSSSTQVLRFRQVNDTIQFELNRARYIAWPSIQTLAILPPSDNASLVTVISCPARSALDSAWLRTYINRQKQFDDVFDAAFLNGIVFTGSKEPESLVAAELKELLDLWGTTWSKHMVEDSPTQPSPGLYVWKNNSLWNTYRMYDDLNGAFMASTRCCPATGYINLRVGGKKYQTLSVIVPSRTLTSPTKTKPLEGLRFVVKDMYRIEGLRTTLGNRGYYDVNVPATANAPAIQRLLDSGAYLVGTTKLACFAAREEPTECVDYQAPYNPRGDGYQSPAGSSSGSAAAIASYDFLDFTIGSDKATGSTRRPAFFNGCFALRPSYDKLPLADYLTPQVYFVGILRLAKQPLLIYPLDYLPTSNPEQMKLLDSFVGDLETTIGTEASKISIREYWNTNGPEEAGGKTIDEFFDEVATQTFLFDFYHNFQRFRDEYYNKHHKSPYINTFIAWRWNLGKSVTQSQRDEAINKINVYKKWFLQEILHEGARDSFVILPIAEVAPNYRDTQPGPHFKQNAFDALFLAPILGAPELVVPSTDIHLINTVERCLKETDRQTVAQTGPTTFKG
ncbi:MAG: hypothetical protein M1819_002669 [Sarea resinae]|nr:MAG: hypothetical protein M1819_002669 [Sarea resinae]